MASMNEVRLLGRLGKDPAMGYTTNNIAMCVLSVAVDRATKNQQGQWEKTTDWFYPTVWRKTAEYVVSKAQKGSYVLLKGRLTGKWVGEAQNNQRFELDVSYSKCDVLSNLRPNQPGQNQQYNQQNQPQYQQHQPNNGYQQQQGGPQQQYQQPPQYQQQPPQ